MGKSVSYYFAVFLILTFLLSMLIYFFRGTGPAAETGGLPTPTPAPPAFEGSGQGSAKVSFLGQQFLVQCPSLPPDAVDRLRKLDGAQDAFKANAGLAVVIANSSTVRLNNATDGKDFALRVGVALPECSQLRVMRGGFVDFTEGVVLDSASGGNKTVYPLQFRAYARRMSVPGVPAFVSPVVTANDSGKFLVVTASLLGDEVQEVIAQQAWAEPVGVTSLVVNGTVNSVSDSEGSAETGVPWGKRALNETLVAEAVNASGKAVALEVLYSRDDAVFVKDGLAESLSNLSFVKTASVAEGGADVILADGGLSQQEVFSALYNYSLSFHSSVLRVRFAAAANASFDEAAAAVAAELGSASGSSANVTKLAVVSITDPLDASREAGAVVPGLIGGVSVQLGAVAGSAIRMELRVVAQGITVLGISAVQARE